MRASEFFTAVRQGKLGPAYFLCGPDRFLHEECRSALIASLPAEAREWCLTEIEFAPGRLARELEGASQMPMLGGHSFLLFSDPEDFKHASDADHEALAAYLDRPSPFATVVIAAVEPDRRRRFIQLLEKKTEVVNLLPLGRREAAEWLKTFVLRAGVEIDTALAEEIAAKFESSKDPRKEGSAGVNLLWARTEVEKLLTAKPGAKRWERDDLDLMVAFREEHVIGKLLQGIAERDFPRALENLRALLASKESEMLLLWSIGDLFRQALKGGGAQGFGPRGRGGWNRWSNPYSTQEIAPQLQRKYSRQEILQALRHVRQADLGVKSSWKDSKILLEFLVWRIIVGRGAESYPAFELPTPAVEA
jgi:DNA polymerase III delta subunit